MDIRNKFQWEMNYTLLVPQHNIVFGIINILYKWYSGGVCEISHLIKLDRTMHGGEISLFQDKAVNGSSQIPVTICSAQS